ncbi:hypothetical protein VNO78_02397 [Psophocarpus tetragonolobus]|uniref:Uncharacterized protein n=1 Tax=Psophocarpus tetragonolobus TaxID=3891 RepID=A0AAN9XV25_PSOTE
MKYKMVSKVEEAKKRNRLQITQCNKGKFGMFKNNSSNMKDDGASSAILLLACIALCTFQPSNACPD